jgi:hypothetical protein
VEDDGMLALLGLTLALLLTAALIHADIHASLYEVTLSNGKEVLVGLEMYEEIMQHFAMLNDPDVLRRWDQAILSVVRAERPNEWRFLVRSLGWDTSVSRRRRESVNV